MIKSLTSMRFFAAFLVLIYHYQWLNIDYSSWPLGQFWQNLYTNGFLGVSFFYVLSGFVLAKAYQQKILSGDIKLGQFYIARFARIYPLHFVTFLIAVPLMSTSPWSESFYSSLPFNLTLTHSFIPSVDYYFSFNSLSWSISNEFFFYALFPFLIRLSTRTLLFIVVIIFALITFAWIGGKVSEEIQKIYHWTFYINPVFRLLEFLFGIVISRTGIQYSSNYPKPQTVAATSIEISALLVVFLAVYFIQFIPGFLVRGSFFAPIFAVVILVFSYEAGLVSKFLSNRYLVYLGEISFAIYMTHQVLIRYLHGSPLVGFLKEHQTIGFCIVTLTVVILSSMSFHILETPLNAWARKRNYERVKN